jgi:hypothetical protein
MTKSRERESKLLSAISGHYGHHDSCTLVNNEYTKAPTSKYHYIREEGLMYEF